MDGMVRVLLDATALPADRGGVGRYVDELAAHLPLLGLDTHVVAQSRDVPIFSPLVGRDQVHRAPGWAARPEARLVWEQTGLPVLARRLAPDVVHSPHYTLPIATSLSRRSRQVVTLHDATFFSDPDLHLGVKARFFRRWTRTASRLADSLITPSASTKHEVVRHAGADPSKITVVPHGVDHARFHPAQNADVAAVRAWLGLTEDTPYLAFLGTLEPRKNVPALIRAFVAACGSSERPPVLVLAGGRGWDRGVDPALSEVPGHLQVLKPGFVPDDLVPALLTGAQVVAYPAFGEGFGLPVLEAMACGAAVLTTRRLSLPEVGGDAVAYADSPDSADLSSALVTLLADPVERRRLSRAALTRAADFTWEATARGHRSVYEAVCAA